MDSAIILFDLPVSSLGVQQAALLCENRVIDKKGGYVCFVTLRSVLESFTNSALAQVLQDSFLNTAMSVPLALLARLKGHSLKERVKPTEFTHHFLRKNPSLYHGFIGPTSGVGQAIIDQYGLNGVSFDHAQPMFSKDGSLEDWKIFLDRFQKNQISDDGEISRVVPDLVWISLKTPEQELWMNSIAPYAPDTLFIGVGDSLNALLKR